MSKNLGRWSVALAASLAFSSCAPKVEAPAELRPPLVEAIVARQGELPLEETVHGVVRAENQVAVRAEINARVEEVLVKSGEAVTSGQVLVRLQDNELRQQLHQAEADVRLAEATAAEVRARAAELESRVARLRTLAADKLISEQDLETQESRLDGEEASSRAAEAKVDQARAVAEERRSALDKSRVRAPVTGQVGVRNAEVGMLVSQGAVLFQVGNLDRVQIEVPLTENMLGRVRPGQPVRVRARGNQQEEVEATLSRISPFLEEGSFSTVGEVDLDNATGRFSPGMFVQVRILYGASERATLVPANCLWEDQDSGRKGVFVIDDSDGLVEPRGRSTESSEQRRSVHFRTVQVAAEGGGIAGVSGIEEGDWIVVTGQQLLEEEDRFEAEDMSESEDESESENQSATFTARVRPISWERVLELQGLQREDLLRGFLAKQQRVASVLGAEIPTDPAEIEKRLEEHARENATAATSGGN